MKTIAIIDDDVHIGDVLTEVLTGKGMRFCGRTQAQKPCTFCHRTGRIWYCSI